MNVEFYFKRQERLSKHMTQAFTQNRPGGDLPWGRLRTFSDVTIMCFFVRVFPVLGLIPQFFLHRLMY